MAANASNTGASVGIVPLLGNLAHFDANHDNKFSKKELATAALAINRGIGDQAQFSLLFTMLAGGKDGAGLFNDANNDKLLSVSELSDLAKADGDGETFKAADFKAKFGDRAEPRQVGRNEALSKIADIAEVDIFQQPPVVINPGYGYGNINTGNTGGFNLGSLFGNGYQQQQQQINPMQLLLQFFQQMFGSSWGRAF